MKDADKYKCMNTVSDVDGMEGHRFEHFCAELLQKVGFSEVSVTPGSGDQGVDILAEKEGVKYAIQCKNYANVLSNTSVQEVSAGKMFYGCHVGVVMTNSTFTSGAIKLANATNVLLWDRAKLEELILKAGGIENFETSTNNDNIEQNDIIDISDEIFDVKNTVSNDNIINTHRKGMTIWSKICLGWSIICLILLVVGLISAAEDMIMVALVEGISFFILGLMFVVLSKSEKGSRYIDLFGKNIKKHVFVIICIVIAYTFVCVAMGLYNVIT